MLTVCPGYVGDRTESDIYILVLSKWRSINNRYSRHRHRCRSTRSRHHRNTRLLPLDAKAKTAIPKITTTTATAVTFVRIPTRAPTAPPTPTPRCIAPRPPRAATEPASQKRRPHLCRQHRDAPVALAQHPQQRLPKGPRGRVLQGPQRRDPQQEAASAARRQAGQQQEVARHDVDVRHARRAV